MRSFIFLNSGPTIYPNNSFISSSSKSYDYGSCAYHAKIVCLVIDRKITLSKSFYLGEICHQNFLRLLKA